MRIVTILTFLILFGCKPSGLDSGVQSVDPGTQLELGLAADGSMRVRSTDGSPVQEVLRIDTAATSVDARTLMLQWRAAQVRVNGAACTASFSGQNTGALICATTQQGQVAPPVANPSPAASPAAVSVGAADMRQQVRILEGMHCGLHYGDKKWQARFDVYIDASPSVLEQIVSVSYDVFSAYNSGRPRVVTSGAGGFDTNVGYLTPVSGWSTGEATVKLLDGNEIVLPGARITWTNPEPDTKPTGEPCN